MLSLQVMYFLWPKSCHIYQNVLGVLFSLCFRGNCFEAPSLFPSPYPAFPFLTQAEFFFFTLEFREFRLDKGVGELTGNF